MLAACQERVKNKQRERERPDIALHGEYSALSLKVCLGQQSRKIYIKWLINIDEYFIWIKLTERIFAKYKLASYNIETQSNQAE